MDKHRQAIIDEIKGIRDLALKAKSGVSDNGYRIGRITPAFTYDQTEKDHALHFQGLVYEQVSEVAKALNNLLKEIKGHIEVKKLIATFDGSPTELIFGAEGAQDAEDV